MDRFWSKVEKTDSCWNWTANKNGAGYGKFGWRKGRATRSRGNARLTAAQVSEIRATGAKAAEVAERLGVCVSHVYSVRRGRVWG